METSVMVKQNKKAIGCDKYIVGKLSKRITLVEESKNTDNCCLERIVKQSRCSRFSFNHHWILVLH